MHQNSVEVARGHDRWLGFGPQKLEQECVGWANVTGFVGETHGDKQQPVAFNILGEHTPAEELVNLSSHHLCLGRCCYVDPIISGLVRWVNHHVNAPGVPVYSR